MIEIFVYYFFQSWIIDPVNSKVVYSIIWSTPLPLMTTVKTQHVREEKMEGEHTKMMDLLNRLYTPKLLPYQGPQWVTNEGHGYKPLARV